MKAHTKTSKAAKKEAASSWNEKEDRGRIKHDDDALIDFLDKIFSPTLLSYDLTEDRESPMLFSVYSRLTTDFIHFLFPFFLIIFLFLALPLFHLTEPTAAANSKSAAIEMYAPSSYNDTVTGETLSSVSDKSDSYSNDGEPDLTVNKFLSLLLFFSSLPPIQLFALFCSADSVWMFSTVKKRVENRA